MNTRRSGGVLRAAPVLVVAVPLLLTGAQAAGAEPAPNDQLSWAVSPTESDGGPRAIFEYDVKPGDVISDSLSVRVIGPNQITFGVYGSDALLNESGVFDVLPEAKPSRDVGSWVEMERARLTVAGDDRAEIPFTLTVPANATPGDHVGGIVTSVATDLDAGKGGNVRLDRRLGARIYLRVAGELKPAIAISRPTVSYRASANPFGGRTEISYTITNKGNTRVQGKRAVKVGGVLGGSSIHRDLPELLPGAILSFTETLAGPRAIGPATVKVEIEPREQLKGELPTSAFVAAAGSVGIWAVPWSQIVLILLLGFAVATVVIRRRRDGNGMRPDRTTPPGRPVRAPVS